MSSMSCSTLNKNINGVYRFELETSFYRANYGITEISISNDTVYSLIEYKGFKSDIDNYLNWKKTMTTGKVIKDFGRFFYLTNYSDSLNLEVRIKNSKMEVFGYNSKFKKTKVFEITKIK